ncbi:MAG: hypothetical protein QOG31_877 [Thermoplasmata archaeon]|jgi:hypothetical protein|nr:hypothetical protein [Thermoplasmata archaeon]
MEPQDFVRLGNELRIRLHATLAGAGVLVLAGLLTLPGTGPRHLAAVLALTNVTLGLLGALLDVVQFNLLQRATLGRFIAEKSSYREHGWAIKKLCRWAGKWTRRVSILADIALGLSTVAMLAVYSKLMLDVIG